MKKWILAVLAGAAFVVGAPAHAESTLVHKQLCSTNNSDNSCTNTGPSAKDLLLGNDPTDGPADNPPTFVTPTVAEVPEPGSWMALAIGGLALVAFGRKRRR